MSPFRTHAVFYYAGFLLGSSAPVVAATVLLEIEPAARGGRTELTARLRDAPDGVSGVLTTIHLPDGFRFVATSLGLPDCISRCELDPEIGSGAVTCFERTQAVFRPQGCDPVSDCSEILFLTLGFEHSAPIRNGDLLRCTIEVAPDVEPDLYEPSCTAEIAQGEVDQDVSCDGEVEVLCEGDCNNDGRVVVGELVQGIALALRLPDAAPCNPVDRNRDGQVAISEIIRARVNFLYGCQYVPAPR